MLIINLIIGLKSVAFYPILQKKNKLGLYFAGRDKCRFDFLKSMADYLASYQIHSFLRIPDLSCYKKSQLLKLKTIEYHNEMISYPQMLVEELAYGCIFDIIQEGQTGLSWRVIEGIMYNKKIITNNPFVLKCKYYNPNYIKLIKRPEDIDIQWIMDDSKINYDYKGDYSPIQFLKCISRDITF